MQNLDRTDTLRLSVEGPGWLDELLIGRIRRSWHLQAVDLVRLDRASGEESESAWARLTVAIDRDGIRQRSRWECSGPLARALCEGAGSGGRYIHARQSRRFTLTLIDLTDLADPTDPTDHGQPASTSEKSL